MNNKIQVFRFFGLFCYLTINSFICIILEEKLGFGFFFFDFSGRRFFLKKSIFNSFLSSFFFSLTGIRFGYFLELNLIGVYFRAKYYRKLHTIAFLLGYSHYVILRLPDNLFVKVYTKRRRILLCSLELSVVSFFVKLIEGFYVPNIYKGTGIKIIAMSNFYKRKKIVKKR